MLVVACIKQVPDTTQVQIDPVTNTLVREGIPFIVNPYDTHASHVLPNDQVWRL